MPVQPDKPELHELRRIRTIAAFQFGRGAERAFPSTIRITRSPHTRKVRHIYNDGKLLATLRAKDGYLALTADGGRAIQKLFRSPQHRVVVVKGVEEFIMRGGNVFAKHVVKADSEIRPGEEVLVVDGRDRLLGVGRSFFNTEEMLSFQVGVAVKVRHGVEP